MADFSKLGLGAGLLGSGLFGLFGKSPSDYANKYLGQIPGQTNQYYQPFFEAGKSQLPGLQEQYSQLLSNPGDKLNAIGGSFQQSPGFKFALQQALQGAGHAAAAGGMAGSPQHEQQSMELANNLANQDYYNWLGQATGLYGQGLQGSQGLAGMGQQSGSSMADMIAQTLAQQGQNAFAGKASRNQGISNLLGGLGALGGSGVFSF